MKIRRPDWDSGSLVEVDINEKPVEEFIDWLFNTSRWQEDREYLYDRVRKLKIEVFAASSPAPVGDAPAKLTKQRPTASAAAR